MCREIVRSDRWDAVSEVDGRGDEYGDTLFTDRNWRILDVLKRVAADLGETAARIALARVASRPGVASTLMGVSRAQQVTNNVAVLNVHLPSEHRAALDDVSSGNQPFLYGLFEPVVRN